MRVQLSPAPRRPSARLPRHVAATEERERPRGSMAEGGWVTWRSAALMNLACIAERADEGLLPAVYREVGRSFRASPSQLGWLTFIRAVVQALSSPLAGFLSLHFDRAAVVGLGTLFWGLSTAAVGLAQSYWQCATWRAINGVGLAIVVPAVQSFVADTYAENSRGVAFGWLNLTGSVGAIVGSMAATILAGYDSVLGIAGWRMAFLGMAVLSALIGWMVHTFVVDPRVAGLPPRRGSGEVLAKLGGIHPPSWRSSWREAVGGVQTVLSVRTFQLIVLQGVVGSLPWQAMVFFTMWLQLVGFSHNQTAFLMALFSSGCALGALFGGWLGDQAAKIRPNSGRIMCAQLSAFLGIPFSYILLVALPLDPSLWLPFAATLFCGGLVISWCQACANNPLFAEVVPPKLRTTIYAFDRAFEGTVAALAAPAVGILAEQLYGYRADKAVPLGGSPVEARALSKGLFACMAIPFGACCMCYGTLYRSYGKDRDRAQEHSDEDHWNEN